ncbi:MAG: TRAP transporter small permease [Planctomycetota bacterium]|jgi:TRAP-type C4-dicarboxylate transport system permease small subunit|nr:TRAP transporter small permease [Planctomycetota bacterium]
MEAILNPLRKLISFCNAVALKIAMAMLMVMLVVVSAHVTMRYVVGTSIFWSEEICRFMMVWVSFLLLPLAQQKGQNIAVDFVVGRFRYSRPGVVTAVIVELIVMLVAAFCLRYGWAYMLRARMTSSEALNIPMYLVYTVLPYSFALTLLACFERLAEIVGCVAEPEKLRRSDRIRKGDAGEESM